MLIEFSVGNFRSFKDRVALSMVAANLVSQDKALDEVNTIPVDDNLRLLTSAAIYGANASGKSNLIWAVNFMRNFVLSSATGPQVEDPTGVGWFRFGWTADGTPAYVGDRIGVDRFRLSAETEDKPAYFEMIFLLDGKNYRYGFEITPQRVIAEWLFFVPKSREAKLFEREGDRINVSTRFFKEGSGRIKEQTRPNALFLSVVAQFNGDIAGKILGWFRQLRINLGINDFADLASAATSFHRTEEKEIILQFIKDLDLGISDIRSELAPATWGSGSEAYEAVKEYLEAYNRLSGKRMVPQMPGQFMSINTTHPKYDAHETVIGSETLNLLDQESAGTRRLFSLALPVLDTLEIGNSLFIDELDARLHPLITRAVIDLFNSKQTNPKGAQLIFTTHDTNLLSNKLFRRDQIWFTEKDRFGATHLYSLAEFKVRNDASFERDYIQGRYGAIPFISSDLQAVVSGENGAE